MIEEKKPKTLKEDLSKLSKITAWFEDQEEIDVEEGLKKVKEAVVLIKESKKKLKEIENEFEEIKKEADLKEDAD
jgi:exonuclease VII small subunit